MKIKRILLRTAAVAAVLALAGVVWLAGHVGRFSSRQTWRQATGMDRLSGSELPQPPPPELPPMRWLGHAGFAIDFPGCRLLLDPNLADRCTIAPRRWASPVTAAELAPVAAVLISHAHRDHLDPATLSQLSSVGAVIVPAGSERWLPAMGAARIVPMQAGESAMVGDTRITALAAAHNGHRQHPYASSIAALSYMLECGDQRIYWAGDTGMNVDFAEIGRRYRPQAAILPIGAYSPRWLLGDYHLTPEEAVEVGKALAVQTVIPGHFGTFTLSLDKPGDALPRFARAAAVAQLPWYLPETGL